MRLSLLLIGSPVIDWLTVRIPVQLPCTIDGGHTLKLDRNGSVTKRIPHRLSVHGSFESSIAIRAPSTEELEISGNPAKWLQGHNLYGPSDPVELLWAVLQRLEGLPYILPCSLAEMGLRSPHSLSGTIITRIDLTEMMMLPSRADVAAFLRTAELTGHLAHRGKGVMRGGTLVYGDAQGKQFTRWQAVLYGKAEEAESHPLPEVMAVDEEVRAWLDGCLRVEVRLGRLELAERGLRHLRDWVSVDPFSLWGEKVAQISFNEGRETLDLDKLPRHLRAVFAAWTTGEDLRRMYAARTFYHYRRQLKALAQVDIKLPPAVAPVAQIVPFRRVLEAVPVGRPNWADRIDSSLGEAWRLSTAA